MSSVEELGERKIIELLLNSFDSMPNMPVPFGDDVSAMDIGNGKLAVMKTDMLVGKTDVPHGMSLWQAARKAVIMNISDFAAKGVPPLAILASIGIPRGLSKKDIQQLGGGLNAGAREYDAYILGGDTNEASDLIISCSVFGMSRKGDLILRSGARPGDYVAVTGFFGNPAVGLRILMENLSVSSKIRKALVNSVLLPQARLNEGLALAQSQVASACIDSSDGLAWSLYELSKASNVGFVLDTLPTAYQTREFARVHNLNPAELTLYGGEEYELLATIPSKSWQHAQKAVENVGGSLIKIGNVTKEKTLLYRHDQKTFSIAAHGWEHFKHF